jgi:hypothetical protein
MAFINSLFADLELAGKEKQKKTRSKNKITL